MEDQDIPGTLMVELADDMHTIITEPVLIANGPDTCKGTGFEDHPAFEASSIRHIGDWYYYVYSSLQGHELCYAMGKKPEGPFTYKGVLISNADLGYKGNILPTNYYGNNHGGLEKIGDKVYVFYHRHTHGTEFSRQGCAEEVHILDDGTIDQAEVTSCGLNGGPLKAEGMYPAYIACHITGPDRSKVGHVINPGPRSADSIQIPEEIPYVTEEGEKENLKPYIHNLRKGSMAGFKYFRFEEESHAVLECRGHGTVVILAGGEVIGEIPFDKDEWCLKSIKIKVLRGTYAVYAEIKEGVLDLAQIGFLK